MNYLPMFVALFAALFGAGGVLVLLQTPNRFATTEEYQRVIHSLLYSIALFLSAFFLSSVAGALYVFVR